MQLAETHVAVTGAGGFIGRRVCARLAAEGCDVAGLDVDPGAAGLVADAGAEFVHCDVTDAESVAAALAGRERVVHTAAIVSDWGPMEDYVRVNVGGTRNVLDAAQAAGAARVVHVSSIAVWGYEYRRELDEDAEPRACGWPYQDTKSASDVLARRRGAVVVRPGDVYGPGSLQWAVRPLEALKAGRLALPRGRDGLVTPVYIDDLVDCIVRALASDDASPGQAFVAWDGRTVTATEFFHHYARMLGRDSLPTAPPALHALGVRALELVARVTGKPPPVSAHAARYLMRSSAYSVRRAREVLGWEPQVTLDEGMRRTEEWFRQEGMLPAAASGAR
jgi:nucleoside-diphosphate-sugar epimerase